MTQRPRPKIRLTNRQADKKQTTEQTNSQLGKQTDRQTNRQLGKQTDRQTNRPLGRQTEG